MFRRNSQNGLKGWYYDTRLLLIHSANTQSWPEAIPIFTNVVRSSVRPSVPAFQNLARQDNTIQVKIMIATAGTVSLAKWIINDTRLLL